MVYVGDVDEASGFFVIGGGAVFESKEDVVGIDDVGGVFCDLEDIFDDGIHLFFALASVFVELVEVEGGCLFYELSGGCGVDPSANAKVFDFFWEYGDLGVGILHGGSFLFDFKLLILCLFWLCG